jgi:hypothetical protein
MTGLNYCKVTQTSIGTTYKRKAVGADFERDVFLITLCPD